MTSRTITMLTSACFLAAVAHGQTPDVPPPQLPPTFERMPGVVLAHLRESLEMRFRHMDANGDDILTTDEFPGRRSSRERGKPATERSDKRRGNRKHAGDRPPRPQPGMPSLRGFKALDRNQDGQVTKEEMMVQVDELSALDTNGDGRVDRGEMKAKRKGTKGSDKKSPKDKEQ